MLNFRKLRTDFAPATLKEGKALWEDCKVKSAVIESLSAKSLKIICEIEGKFSHLYKQTLEIDRSESELEDSQCTCEEGFDCQHIACATYYLEDCLDKLIVAFSQDDALEQTDLDDEEKEHILDTFKEAQEKERAKKVEKHDKEVLEEYNNASFLLSHSPFFQPEEVANEEIAELLILFQIQQEKKKKRNNLVEFQIALRLPFRTKPLLLNHVQEFLDGVRYQEPLWLQHKRYFLPTSSFDLPSAQLLQILLSHAKFYDQPTEKQERLGLIELEVFGMLLASSYELGLEAMKQRGHPMQLSQSFALPCLYMQSMDEPLISAQEPVHIRFDLQFVQNPVKALLLDPQLELPQELVSLEKVTLLDCAKPGLLREGVYHRFSENIKRKHLKSLEPIRNMAVPEPHFGTFVENSLPELTMYARVDNTHVLDKCITYPFAGDLKAVCHVHYLDGDLEAHINFLYDALEVPYAPSQVKVDMIKPFVSSKGVLARSLHEEQKIVDDLFQDFSFDQKSGMFKSCHDKKIVEFMTETIPRYQNQITFHCPENLLEQFIYEETSFTLELEETESVDAYRVTLHVQGPLKGVTVDTLWDCIATKKSFIEISQGKGRRKKATKFLVLDLDKLAPIVQIFDEMGLEKLTNHTEERPLWSLVTLSQESFENLPITCTMTDKLIELQEQMLGTRSYSSQPVPSEVQATPRAYQVEGIGWLERLRTMHLNGILADDMGLGKTLQAIIALTQYHKENPQIKSIIVCPTSLVYNWKEEFHKFSPHLNILIVDGTPAQRKKLVNHIDSYDIVITSYSLLQKDIALYKKQAFGYAILDEAQHIKNRTTQNAKSVKALLARHRLILTGTPVENALEELWSLFDFLMPGLLSSYDRFLEKYVRIPKLEHKEVMENLKKKVSPFILRRMKKDVLEELPPVSEMVYHCHLTPTQQELYRSYALSAKEELSQLVEKEGFDRVHIHVLATLTRLKQICCHPAIFAKDDRELGDSAKYDLLVDLLQNLIENQHKTVIFSQYTRMLQIMRDDLQQKNIPFAYLDGSTKKRLEIVKEFNENDSIPIFLVSLKAGGTGLNLTGADTVIHYDMWWNPAVENQATDRVHRMGQQKSVSSYKLVTKNTIEEKIVDLQKRKKGLVKQVVSTDDEAMSKLTWEEVLELLQT